MAQIGFKPRPTGIRVHAVDQESARFWFCFLKGHGVNTSGSVEDIRSTTNNP